MIFSTFKTSTTKKHISVDSDEKFQQKKKKKKKKGNHRNRHTRHSGKYSNISAQFTKLY